VGDMKKMYIKSLSEVESNLIYSNDLYIADLILFDLDDDRFYYVRNENVLLEKCYDKISGINDQLNSINKYITEALDNSFEINENIFRKCLKMKMKDIYKINKNVFLFNHDLGEWII
jgi:hypothetical protein